MSKLDVLIRSFEEWQGGEDGSDPELFKQQIKNLMLELLLEAYGELDKLPAAHDLSEKLRKKVSEL